MAMYSKHGHVCRAVIFALILFSSPPSLESFGPPAYHLSPCERSSTLGTTGVGRLEAVFSLRWALCTSHIHKHSCFAIPRTCMLSAHFTPHRGKALRLNLFHGHKSTFVICLAMGSGSGSGDPLDSIDDKPSNLGLVKNQEIESGMKDHLFQSGALSSDYVASVDGSDYMESSLAENCEGQVPMLRKKPNIPADALAGTQQASFFHMLLLTYSRALLTHEAAQSPTEFNSASQDSKEAGSATERVCGSSSSASSSTSNAGKDREGRRAGGRGGEGEGSMEGATGTKWKVKKRARPTNAASVSGTLGLSSSFFSFFSLKKEERQ